MRAKIRRRLRPRATRAHEPDGTGLTIDWIGVQATGSGGGWPWWIVGPLAAIRAAPFVAWRIARRATGRRTGGGSPTGT